MDNFEAYAPPKAAVSDAGIDAPKIPLAFKIFLVVLLALDLFGRISGGAAGGLVWDGVLAIAAWRTMAGSRPASRVLGGLLTLMAVMSAVVAVPLLFQKQLGTACVVLFLVAYMLALAGYIFFSPTMQAVFRKADARKWSGG
jgi:cell division protein FtsW (lipid II flippase)